MPTSLVTGGAGFIGSHVAAELRKLGHTVVVLDDLSGGFSETLPAGAQFIEGSILDMQLIESLFQAHHFTYVFHLAAVVMDVMGTRLPLNHLPARNEVVHAYSDHSKARRVFGNQPPVCCKKVLRAWRPGPRSSDHARAATSARLKLPKTCRPAGCSAE
jgi:hypothetical protein